MVVSGSVLPSCLELRSIGAVSPHGGDAAWPRGPIQPAIADRASSDGHLHRGHRRGAGLAGVRATSAPRKVQRPDVEPAHRSLVGPLARAGMGDNERYPVSGVHGFVHFDADGPVRIHHVAGQQHGGQRPDGDDLPLLGQHLKRAGRLCTGFDDLGCL